MLLYNLQFIIEVMLVKYMKNKVIARRLLAYFCNNSQPPGQKALATKLTKTDKFVDKKQSKQYLMLPLNTFMFSHKPYSIKIDRAFYQLLQKHEIKEAVSFPLKQDSKQLNLNASSYTELKTKMNIPDVKQKKESNPPNWKFGHHPLLVKTEKDGIPYVNSINDVYPIGTLCDLTTEDVIENSQVYYILTLMPKSKVEINLEVAKEKNQFFINGINQYESFSVQTLEPAPKQMNHLQKLYQKSREPLNAYYQNNNHIERQPFFRQDQHLIGKNSLQISEMCCFICNTSLFLTNDQKFQIYKQKSLKKVVELLFNHYNNYLNQFAKLWNTIYQQKQTGDKTSINDSLRYLQKNMQRLLKVQVQSDPEVQELKSQISQGKQKNIFPPHILQILETEMRDIDDFGSMNANNQVKSKKHRIKTLLSYPFGKFNPDNYNLKEAKAILDEDHFGMKKVKERILEFLAVGSLKGSVKSKVILLHGPPGVGKTSIVRSIARCMGRPYHRISLGGETDPSTLRGHKRTYIGAYPGKVFEAIKRSKVENPIILLDEIDKMERRHSGGSVQNVLMNILDPAQNYKFKDDFVDAEIDISNVLFVCTANKIGTIIQPLLDRMEKINVDGYSTPEKKQIFNKFLLPKAIKENGIDKHPIKLSEESLTFLVDGYNRQPGMRSLEQAINKICQKIAFKCVTEVQFAQELTKQNIVQYLGPPTYTDRRMYGIPPPGMMVGLAYSEAGGGIMYIQATKSNIDQTDKEGKKKQGKLTITGNLQIVIKESSQIALSYAKYILNTYFNNDFLEHNDVHLNFLGVGTPKQGPSAGIAITSTLISLALNRPTTKQIAMTGEINLSGHVCKIGGVKEKVLAAKREGILNILLPIDNKHDFQKLDDEIKSGLHVVFASDYSQVMKQLFDIDLKELQQQKKQGIETSKA